MHSTVADCLLADAQAAPRQPPGSRPPCTPTPSVLLLSVMPHSEWWPFGQQCWLSAPSSLCCLAAWETEGTVTLGKHCSATTKRYQDSNYRKWTLSQLNKCTCHQTSEHSWLLQCFGRVVVTFISWAFWFYGTVLCLWWARIRILGNYNIFIH